MATWVKGTIRLTEPLLFEHPEKNVVILGDLSSDHDIVFKVKNLVVFGTLSTSKHVLIQTSKDFFNSGKILAKNGVDIVADHAYNRLNEEAIERIRALGIELTQTPSGLLNVVAPR